MKENKLLIIAIGRCGSTSLASAFHQAVPEYRKLKLILEPYNPAVRYQPLKKDYDFSEFSVVKVLANQIPTNSSLEDHYSTLLSKFKNIILLSRKDREDVLTSFTYHMTYNPSSWHAKYSIKDISTLPLDRYRVKVEEQYERLDYISDVYNLPIYYYEDIFSGNSDKVDKFIDSIGINLDKDIFYSHINPKDRQRVFNSNSIFI